MLRKIQIKFWFKIQASRYFGEFIVTFRVFQSKHHFRLITNWCSRQLKCIETPGDMINRRIELKMSYYSISRNLLQNQGPRPEIPGFNQTPSLWPQLPTASKGGSCKSWTAGKYAAEKQPRDLHLVLPPQVQHLTRCALWGPMAQYSFHPTPFASLISLSYSSLVFAWSMI